MEDIGKLFSVLGIVFLLLGLIFNIIPNLPRIPGDIYFDKAGFKIYIPFTSSILLSVILILLFNLW
ncbi:DUF2905 domain-containing protein [Candidatus Daviesbacteria bacterium]|nr:DUF2905 domain-containing protein [Candidatus Daviesbacteria bacterium]